MPKRSAGLTTNDHVASETVRPHDPDLSLWRDQVADCAIGQRGGAPLFPGPPLAAPAYAARGTRRLEVRDRVFSWSNLCSTIARLGVQVSLDFAHLIDIPYLSFGTTYASRPEASDASAGLATVAAAALAAEVRAERHEPPRCSAPATGGRAGPTENGACGQIGSSSHCRARPRLRETRSDTIDGQTRHHDG